MIEFTLRHSLDCSPDRHWDLFFDPDWTRSLLEDGLGLAVVLGALEHRAERQQRAHQLWIVLGDTLLGDGQRPAYAPAAPTRA